MIYIASPYSHPLPEVRELRAREAAKHSADLLVNRDLHIISPIVHCHEMQRYMADESTSFDVWESYCLRLLAMCESMIILKMQGWHESRGIRAEIEFCFREGKAIKTYDPNAGQVTVYLGPDNGIMT